MYEKTGSVYCDVELGRGGGGAVELPKSMGGIGGGAVMVPHSTNRLYTLEIIMDNSAAPTDVPVQMPIQYDVGANRQHPPMLGFKTCSTKIECKINTILSVTTRMGTKVTLHEEIHKKHSHSNVRHRT